jgi:hypothetical protein
MVIREGFQNLGSYGVMTLEHRGILLSFAYLAFSAMLQVGGRAPAVGCTN